MLAVAMVQEGLYSSVIEVEDALFIDVLGYNVRLQYIYKQREKAHKKGRKPK